MKLLGLMMEKPGVTANVPRVAQLLDSERKSTFYRRNGIGIATTKESQKQNSCVAGTGSLFKRLAGWAQPHRPGERSPVLTCGDYNSHGLQGGDWTICSCQLGEGP